MKRLSVLAALCVFAGPASAIAPKNATYYCTNEAAGGVSYEERQSRWAGTVFRPSKPFVLKLNYLGSSREKMYEWADPSDVARFNVTVTAAGSNKDIPCYDLRDPLKPILVWGNGWVRCESSLSEIRFNTENNRFMRAYLVGYVDGEDNNENTPSISIGVCTKLN
ncbi:hypothetical protein [Bradyrhizobium sp. NBAIM01]|uniref:hypothetical protein n=1 Tax=Bradyrhizobium sp. NBAIM01 TaxID=2793818 RepID=UPI001CD4EAD4|nr:hypothetical protein [Bradyrhizobium sp. NBAIM01]MCA1514559.1 hypothetical protein [Bradyrhizobium sp. NBAIM01]